MAPELSCPVNASFRYKITGRTSRIRTVKFSMGGGGSSPSTMMWYFSRILLCCSSVRSATNLGGLHLQNLTQKPRKASNATMRTTSSRIPSIEHPSPTRGRTPAFDDLQWPPESLRQLPLHVPVQSSLRLQGHCFIIRVKRRRESPAHLLPPSCYAPPEPPSAKSSPS